MNLKSVSNKHICHLTVLNPAKHSRIFYKAARSQVAEGYQVSIIGQDAAAAAYDLEGVRIHPTGIFSRMHLARWQAAKKIAQMAIATQADIFQIHAPELLPVSREIQAALPAARFVYDMHEDYRLNILHAGYYPRWLRGPLSRKVRKAEMAFAKWGAGVIYAEDCFSGILPFSVADSAIVRNRFLPPAEIVAAPAFGDERLPLLLYSGTIALNWGVMDALALWQALQAKQAVRLCIAGHTHDRELLQQIAAFVQASGYAERFFLAGGAEYLPYSEMVGWIQAADLGLALYQLRGNIRDRIPTKFYEFMAAGKPVVFTENSAWNVLNAELGFGLAVKPKLAEADLAKILARIYAPKQGPFQGRVSRADFAWEPEAGKLLALLGGLKFT
ncbi:MAG TPA: glycosyltransferase [Bacteroidetes bacterium]|nr:glycosyltransferase [Bacteroidota bacterium]